MKSFRIINGPNLDLLGKRQPEIYGTVTFEAFLDDLKKAFPGIGLDHFQSNHEGELIEALRAAQEQCAGVVFNPGGYAHTSVAIRDAMAMVDIPVVEVHISNIHAREEFRHNSITAPVSAGIISGFGLEGYRMALDHLVRRCGL